jgi:hypothetical protein
MNRPNTDHPDWHRGLPDFVEENNAFKRDAIFAAVLILSFVVGAYVALHF